MGTGKPASMSRMLRLAILEPQELQPKALTFSEGAWFIAWPLRRSFLRNLDVARSTFKAVGVFGLRPCHRTHLKKALYHTRLFGGAPDKYRDCPLQVPKVCQYEFFILQFFPKCFPSRIAGMSILRCNCKQCFLLPIR